MRLARSLLLCAALLSAAASAAELKVFMAEALSAAIDPITRDFEQATGHKVTLVYATAGVLRERVRAGEAVDVVLLPRSAFDPLMAEQKFMAGTRTPVAQSMISIAVRRGFAKPDVSSVDALKASLLAARAIAHSDPAGGGAIGVHAAKVIEQLGIAEQMRPKTRTTPGGGFHELLVKGEVDLAFVQPVTAARYPELEIAGPLPAQLQDLDNFVYVAAVAANTREPAAARAYIQHLASPAAAGVIKSKGIEPLGQR
ncbi:molybdate ABC transporter substrate-binding protein [Ramlibacter albus]|uniref:Substrate-binding domain-containing protein n=1 Tax=Ramlibacter albus TaxID=2079448 RepID=A0A923MEI7_9BURK|nr:substrate-binding domain-containing protein [Ramlibacter albus]MBC5768565.1 substrate-binding domain-containing protein [Ramlibacter albus]